MRCPRSLRPSAGVAILLLASLAAILSGPPPGPLGKMAGTFDTAVPIPVANVGVAQKAPHLQPSAKTPVSTESSRASRSLNGPTTPNLPASVVNPTQFYTREPAPMGIADFGVDGSGSGSVGYSYTSPAFEGQATIHSMSITISGSTSKVMAFELNAVALLQRGGTNYSYWIQNGLHLDATSHEFTIGGAYVWNFSSAGAHLSAGELSGAAGSVLVTDTYYFIPSCGAAFSGQCTTIPLPSTLTGRIYTSTSGGVPFVDYQYNLGSGWVTYDNVSFQHMTGASDLGFLVDGFVHAPYSTGAFYDAEWDWVGAGGGSSAVDQGSDLNLSLDFWNGHNYQAVPSAWNFGGDTGETSTNVSESISTSASGVPGAYVASGSGTLGVLYNRTSAGFLNVTIPTLLPETLVLDGVGVPLSGGWANLTLLPGTHSLYLENFTNSSRVVAVDPGSTTFLALSGAGQLVFVERGLPAGTSWGVSVNGSLLTSSVERVVLNLPNGTYPVTYPAVPGFIRTGSTPSSVTLPGDALVQIDFSTFTYSVPIAETGLPDATTWWVDVNGTVTQGSGPTIQVSAPNGSTPFEVGAGYEFVANPANGSILVLNGLPYPVSVAFSYRPSFIQGVVSPSNATVSIDGLTQPTSGGSFTDQVIPGTHQLVVTAPGFLSQSETVTTTPGNTSWQNVTLVATESPGGSTSPSTGTGSIPVTTVIIVVVGAGAVVTALAYLVLRRRR